MPPSSKHLTGTWSGCFHIHTKLVLVGGRSWSCRARMRCHAWCVMVVSVQLYILTIKMIRLRANSSRFGLTRTLALQLHWPRPKRLDATLRNGRRELIKRIAPHNAAWKSPVATSDLDAWDLGPVTILSMQPTRGFPNNIHPGGLYRLTACTHQCTTSSRQHTATQSHRHVSRQAGPPGRTCHVHASTWTNLPERLSALHARALTGLRPLRETHRRFQNVPRRRPLMSKTYLRFGPMPAKAIS